MRAMAITLGLMLAAPVAGPAGAQPSFDCGAARTATEKTICARPALADLERRLVAVYDGLVAAAGEAEARRIADIQLERREACGSDAACIERQLLTTIGVFRAETDAARAPAPAPERAATDDSEAALRDLRAALGRGAPEAPQAGARTEAGAGGPSPEELARRRAAGLEAGFDRLPDYRQRLVQGRLAAAGFLEGSVDGMWGTATLEAMRRFLDAAHARGVGFAVGGAPGSRWAYRLIESEIFHEMFPPE
ncbi:hypothetical protein [Limimaricola pyoseonensis]|uniref:Peptidoglycan binding domain-containing protein n=1 Tax=Limimaricola pyoseonensis TaxID=521013 RepID=A0A1G7IT93_9RHOB|nr:hypothetical protein [Limimaricola pyoseonensis]SDF15901.1 hypothetical protein SAMN04488567_3519 [Limimaricola pyoseonensis]